MFLNVLSKLNVYLALTFYWPDWQNGMLTQYFENEAIGTFSLFDLRFNELHHKKK